MQGYREWLSASAMGSLGGSLDSIDIDDYYLTPTTSDMGCLVRFDHDFIGRDALQQIAATPRRTKVVEEHCQVDIRATVAPCPYEPFAREAYRADGPRI